MTTKRQQPVPTTAVADLSAPSRESREFDVVLFGVTGFTGHQAAKYVSHYSTFVLFPTFAPSKLPPRELRTLLSYPI